MRILFLGDVVGISGCSKLMNNLLNEIKLKKIDFVIVNGENAATQGVGLTKEICNDFFNCGVDVITTGNHVWDQKEIMEFIDKEDKLFPKYVTKGSAFGLFIGMGFGIYDSQTGGDIFMSDGKTKGLFHLELSSNVLAIRPAKILPRPELVDNTNAGEYVFPFEGSLKNLETDLYDKLGYDFLSQRINSIVPCFQGICISINNKRNPIRHGNA